MKKDKAILQKTEEPETAYLTTRAIERALTKATRHLTEQAMQLRGYVVTVEKDWVVKRYSNGKVDKIEKVKKVKLSKHIELP